MLSIRFARVGKKNKAQFKIMLQNSTVAPGGRHVEILGSYDPHQKAAVLKDERIKYWLEKGAQASDSVHNLLVSKGVITDKKRAVKLPKKKVEETEAEEAKTEEAKKEEVSTEDSKKEEVKTEEAPKVEEAPKEEVKAEASKEPVSAEATAGKEVPAEEAPKEEVKTESASSADKEASKVEEAPKEPASAEATAGEGKKAE